MLTNQNGLLVDESGTVRGLDIAISDCPVSGLPRRAYHESLIKTRNLQMVHRVGVTYLTADGAKTVREEIREIITDQRQQNAQLDKWQDQVLPFSTEGAFVSNTGQIVTPGTPGAIEQLAFMQALTVPKLQAIGMPITANTPVLHIEYMMMIQQIQQYDATGRL